MDDASSALGGTADVAQIGLLPQPWGFWSTTAWVLAALALAVAVIVGALLWLSRFDLMTAVQDPASLSLQVVLSNVVLTTVLGFAAGLSGWPISKYLALNIPRAHDVFYSVVVVAVFLAALEILTYLLGRESVTPFQIDSYRTAQTAGLLPFMWLAFVLAAPVGEEITFRGFLFRGWAASRLGVQGTILLSALIFAALHPQYDWFGVVQTLSFGALFGWLRWRSGSTTLTILLHMGVNLLATLLTAGRVHGLL